MQAKRGRIVVVEEIQKKSISTTDVCHTLFAHFMKYVIKKLNFYSFGGFCLDYA